jgi:uncharacterized protein
MLTITALTACCITLLLTALSINISRLRIRHRVSYGHGNHKDLEVAIRAHGNSLEQSLLFLLLLLIAESMGGQTGANALAWMAGGFVLIRCVHGLAALTRNLRLRQISHAASVLLQLGCCVVIALKASGA